MILAHENSPQLSAAVVVLDASVPSAKMSSFKNSSDPTDLRPVKGNTFAGQRCASSIFVVFRVDGMCTKNVEDKSIVPL